MGRKTILYITYYWPPSGGAGVQRSLKFIKYLPEIGFDPIVLTVDPTYASYPVLDNTLANDVNQNILIKRTRSFEALKILTGISGSSNIPYGGFSNQKRNLSSEILKWIRGNIFIPDARIGWVNYAYKEAVNIIKQHDIKTVVISSPPHSSQIIGLKLKKKFPEINWVADLRDPWTDIYYNKDLLQSSLAKKRDSKIEVDVLLQANTVVVVSEFIKRQFEKKSTEIDPHKIVVIPNGFDEYDFQDIKIDFPAKNEEYLLTYVGTIADSYNPQVIFKALKIFYDKHPDLKKFKVRFVGSQTGSMYQTVKDYGLEDVILWETHVSHTSAIGAMQESKLLLLIIPDTEGANGILTGKLFEYLRSYKPILAIGPKGGNAATIIEECNAGSFFERNEDIKIVEYIESFVLNEDIYHGKIDKINKYSRKNLTLQIAKYF